MDIETYQPFWEHAEPLMKAKLAKIKQCLQEHWLDGKSELTLSEIIQGGDEEFRLTLDLRRGDITVLGMDFILLDADVNGATEGVGIKLDIVGYGGLALGGYSPFNYTPDAFTLDKDEIEQRIDQLDVDDFAAFVINEALTNKQLAKELATAD